MEPKPQPLCAHAGVAIVSGGKLQIKKRVGKVRELLPVAQGLEGTVRAISLK